MTSNPPIESLPPDSHLPIESPPAEIPSKRKHSPLLRWTIALCIFTAGGFTFNELYSNIFETYTILIAGTALVGWGLITSIGSVVGAVFFLIWSTISDNLRTRMGRRIPLMLLGGVGTAILAILFAMSTNYIWLVIDGGLLMAVTRSMLGTSRSLIADLIPQEKRGRTNTLLTIMTNVGSVIFFIPAMMLLFGDMEKDREANMMFILIFSLIFLLMIIISVALIREPPVAEPPRRWTQDLRKILNWQEMKKNKNFLKIFVANLFVQAGDSAFFSYFFMFIIKIFDTITFDVITIAICAPIVGVALGVGLVLMARSTDRVGRKISTLIGLGCAPIGALIIASAKDILTLLIGFAVFLPLYLGGTSAMESWVQDILPKEARGRFFGLINITSALGVAFGAMLSGMIGEANIFWIFVATALFLWISIPFFLRVPETLKRKNPEVPKEEIPHSS